MPSVNKQRPHLFVLPEDQANIDIANGFQGHESVLDQNLRILSPAGGWGHVVDLFLSDYQREMRTYPTRFMVLLLDFDERTDRLAKIQSKIPNDLMDRIFVLGAFSEPEKLKAHLGCSYEEVGRRLAEDCRLNTINTWEDPLLRNNIAEVARLGQAVRSFLIKS